MAVQGSAQSFSTEVYIKETEGAGHSWEFELEAELEWMWSQSCKPALARGLALISGLLSWSWPHSSMHTLPGFGMDARSKSAESTAQGLGFDFYELCEGLHSISSLRDGFGIAQPRASCMLGKCRITELHTQIYKLLGCAS